MGGVLTGDQRRSQRLLVLPPMATQGATPEIISSILLAVWRMYPPKPEQVLRHLVNPPPPNDYRYLDAFAALCSLVPQCESASAAALKLGGDSIHLYIATTPLVPDTLRRAMVKWIQLIQQIPVTTASSEAQTLIGNFITDVYRVCHTKLFDSIQCQREGEDFLEEVLSMPEPNLRQLGLDALGCSSLVDSLKVLTSMAGHDLEASSTKEILRLHAAARTAAKYKDNFPDIECELCAIYF